MKLTSSFLVPAEPAKVLARFLDAETMRACIPGCEELVQVDERHYRGMLVNEVAHVKFKAGFTAEIESLSVPFDSSEPAVVLAVLRGEDRRLGSTIKIDARLTVAPVQTSDTAPMSNVEYMVELAIWGKLGRLGESVIRRRTAEVEHQFAEALTAVCAGQPIPGPGGSLADLRDDDGSSQAADGGVRNHRASPAAPAFVLPREVLGRSWSDWAALTVTATLAFAFGLGVGRRR